MENNKITEKASQQILTEALGFEQGSLYFLLLTKNAKEIKEQFSHSKKYRLLKDLYDMGAIAKIKSKDRDLFSYILLPPTFLHRFKIDKSIIEHLEDIYTIEFNNIFERKFCQIVMKDETGFVTHLIKSLMKSSANVRGEFLYYNALKKNYREKIVVQRPSANHGQMGIIDNDFVFEFSCIKNHNGCEHIGYITDRQSDVEDVRRRLKVL